MIPDRPAGHYVLNATSAPLRGALNFPRVASAARRVFLPPSSLSFADIFGLGALLRRPSSTREKLAH